MGLLLNNLGHYQEAGGHFQKALLVNPNYVNALLWYRNVLTGQLRNQEAMKMTQRALGLDPLSPPVRRMNAHQLIEMLRYDDAETEIQALIAANPDDPAPYEIWGDLFRKRGLPQNSIPMYRNAHRLRPGDIYMAAQNTEASLELDDENLVSYWLKEAQLRGTEGQWTRNAENLVMYATGNFDALLAQVNQLLEAQPGRTLLLRYRSAALMDKGEFDSAGESLQLALAASGYATGQQLSGDQLSTAVQLANVFDQLGNAEERDLLLSQITKLLEKIRQSEPSHKTVFGVSACVASIQNDLPAVLRELELAVKHGFRSHWELIRNPVFKRWQDNTDFLAFHQNMIKAAADMRREYEINNPVQKTEMTVKGFN